MASSHHSNIAHDINGTSCPVVPMHLMTITGKLRTTQLNSISNNYDE